MASLRALLVKELKQHGPAVGMGTALLIVAWLVARASFAQEARTLSVLQVVSGFATFPLGAAALWLGHRLVVTEYYARTQRFVEALPIARGLLALTKAAVGLAVLELWAMLALAAGAWAAARTEPIGARFLAIMAARLGVFVFALWGAVFLFAFFGRLRVALAGAVAALLLTLDRSTTFALERFGPFALIAGETFGFERQHPPWRALAEAAAIGVVCLAGGWALARVREGSVVEALARPLAARELSALLVVGLGGALAFASFEEERITTPPALTTEKAVRREEAPLVIAYFDDELRVPAERLGATMGPTLASFRQAVGWPEPLPPVRLTHAPDADPEEPERETLSPGQGLALAVNLTRAAERPTELVALVLHQLVWARTRGRAGLEPKHWLLDGFTYHFTLFGQTAAPALTAAPDPWLLRALAAHRIVPVGVEALAAYHATAERLGDPATNALAASGWRVLEARVGRARTLALARAAFGRRGTADVRDYLHERRHPLAALFAETTGLPWEAFVADWKDTLDRIAAQPGAAALLDQVPRGRLEVRSDGALNRVSVVGSLARPPAAGTFCSLLHQRLAPFDAEIPTELLERTRFLWPEGERDFARTVEAPYGSGERAFVALDCEPPALGFPLRLLARRVTVP
jgi:hypothetical protein